MISKQSLLKKGGKKGRKKGKRKKKMRRRGKEQRKKKNIRTKKIEIWKAKKDDFGVTILGSFLKSAMGRLSKSMEQYTVYTPGPFLMFLLFLVTCLIHMYIKCNCKLLFYLVPYVEDAVVAGEGGAALHQLLHHSLHVKIKNIRNLLLS